MFKPTKKQHLVNKNYADKNGGSGGGGTEPLIIHVTEEEVKDPETQERIGYKTDVLASDAYEAWQNGRPIYYSADFGEWLVFHVSRLSAVTILANLKDKFTTFKTLREYEDGYLYLEAHDGPIG